MVETLLNVPDEIHEEAYTKAQVDGLLTNMQTTTNKSSSISTDTGSTTKYPSVKAVEDYAQQKNLSSSITTDTGSTTKYPSVKAVEDYIDAVIGDADDWLTS